MSGIDLARVRADFPILRQQVHGRRLVYLDNAATTQKPEAVLRAIDDYYRTSNANVHRAVHTLADRATRAYEAARDTIASFLGTRRENVVFTRGTTEAINLVAYSFLEPRLSAGDEILVTEMEHHSNIVPWQLVAERTGARVVPSPISDDGELLLDALRERITARTRLVAVSHCSNALGTINPVADIVEIAHQRGVPVLIDGAQAIAHLAVDFDALGADFYACSAHKAYGPTGFGALCARAEHLQAMRPWHGGGDMIESVSFDGTTYNEIPYRFEAGTPHIAGAIGFAAALDYIRALGLGTIAEHEHALLAQALEAVRAIDGVRVVGAARQRSAILGFTVDGSHPADVAAILDQLGIAIRAGHHCAMPLMRRYGLSATARASFAVYNGPDDVEVLIEGLRKVRELFA